MDYKKGIEHCLNKIGSKQEYMFKEQIPTCTVGSKKFCILLEKDGVNAFALKSDPELNIVLRSKYEGILLPKNLDKRYWNVVLLDSDVPDDEIFFLIDQSYSLVFDSLTKKVQRELNEKT